jgi:type I restriction enzyme S subunit
MALDNLSAVSHIGFLADYLRHRGFDDVITGSAQPQIIRSNIEKILVPLPPLEVQRQIADVLDRASALIEKRKAQIDKLDLMVKSQFIDMFGDPVANPKEWKIRRLGECLERIENGTSPKCEAFPASPEQQGVLKLSAVTYGYYQSQENKQLLPDTVFDSRIEVKDNDLLMTRKNTYGLVGMSAYVFSTQSGLMLPDLVFRLIPKEIIHRIYLWQLINCDLFRESIKRLAGGTAGSMPNISKERLKTLDIPLPPFTLQNEFAAFVQRVEAQKIQLKKSLELLELNYKSLSQKCFKMEVFK